MFPSFRVGLFNGLLIKTTTNINETLDAKDKFHGRGSVVARTPKRPQRNNKKLFNIFRKGNYYLISQKISAFHYRSSANLRSLAQKDLHSNLFKN